jgi:hypothetical protein
MIAVILVVSVASEDDYFFINGIAVVSPLLDFNRSVYLPEGHPLAEILEVLFAS